MNEWINGFVTTSEIVYSFMYSFPHSFIGGFITSLLPS